MTPDVNSGVNGTSNPMLDAALTWYDADCSIVPIRANGTKKPMMDWSGLQKKRASRDWVQAWYEQHPRSGIGIICGAVSGNLEMLELEGRASTAEHLDRIINEAQPRGIDHLFIELLHRGLCVWTPSGGLHLIYRVSDHPVPGNTKIARRPATLEELEENPEDRFKVLSETRGEGGYFVAAPSGGTVHPTGDSWTVAAGEIGVIPTITWQARCDLHEAIHAALDEMPAAPAQPPRPAPATLLQPRHDRPGDDFNERADWRDILEPHGWRITQQTHQETYWVRPGKNARDGHSATTGRANDADRLYVFSSATAFEPERPYNKFHAYAVLNHNGDFTAAARELGRRGYGRPLATGGVVANPTWTREIDQHEVVVRLDLPEQESREIAQTLRGALFVNGSGTAIAPRDYSWGADFAKPHIPDEAFVYTNYTLRGAGLIYADVYQETFKYCAKTKHWYFFDGRAWQIDHKLRHEHGVGLLIDAATAQGKAREANGGGDELTKWARTMGRSASPTMSRWARFDPRIAVEATDFDAQRHLVTVGNCTLDLDTGSSMPHDPKHMLSRMTKVDYDPDAQAPRWQQFLDTSLPDPEVRNYIQRAVGATMLGDSGERAFFLLHGESGTGKSQFVKVMELMFGDFGQTASPQTFNAGRSGISNDLNDLHGKRFVALSELNEGQVFDEALLKRLAGGDTAVSRALYQENQRWRVEFLLWMATNYLPRLNSDDNAIWRRVKPIKFGNVVSEAAEVKNLGEELFALEASGILNWMLEGVRLYQKFGLGDLDQIKDEVASYRHDVDNVAQYVEAGIDNHNLALGENHSTPARTLHHNYSEWCRNNDIKPLGERRFSQRMKSLGYQQHRSSSGRFWMGLAVINAGWLSTWIAPSDSRYRMRE